MYNITECRYWCLFCPMPISDISDIHAYAYNITYQLSKFFQNPISLFGCSLRSDICILPLTVVEKLFCDTGTLIRNRKCYGNDTYIRRPPINWQKWLCCLWPGCDFIICCLPFDEIFLHPYIFICRPMCELFCWRCFVTNCWLHVCNFYAFWSKFSCSRLWHLRM